MVLFGEGRDVCAGAGAGGERFEAQRIEPPTGSLVVRAQRGDAGALERLVERHLAALTGFCRRLAGAQGGAQDLVQETLLRAVLSLARLEEPERFEAWLFGIAANVARKQWQREQRAPLSLDTAMAHPDAEGVTVRPLWEPPAGAGILAERAGEVERAMGTLPAAMGQVLALHYADGLSYAEIAAQLGVPVSTVKGRLFKSRRRLRLALGVAGGRPPLRTPVRSARRAPEGAAPGAAGAAGAAGAEKGKAMQEQTRAHDAERLIASAEERVAKSADFLQHWFGRPVGVRALAESGKEVLRRATAESERLLHNYLGTEHVLLGLLGDGAAIPARAMAESGVELEPVRELVQRRIGRGTALVEGEIAMVPRVKTVVEMAGNEARRLGAEAVGAEHLLLGLLREGGGIGALAIATLGADLYDVRDRTLRRSRYHPRHPRRMPIDSRGFRGIRSWRAARRGMVWRERRSEVTQQERSPAPAGAGTPAGVPDRPRSLPSRRRFLAALGTGGAAAVLLPALGACGAPGGQAPQRSAELAGAFDLIYQTWSVGDVYHEQAVTAFQKAHPQVKVNLVATSYGDLAPKVRASIAAGSGPDGFQTYTGFWRGTTPPPSCCPSLPVLFKRAELEQISFPNLLNAVWSKKNEMYMLPHSVGMNGSMLVYNETLLKTPTSTPRASPRSTGSSPRAPS